MRAQFDYVRYLLLTSFWFLPGLMVLVAVGLAFATLYLDYGRVVEAVEEAPWVYTPSAEGARELLSTTAGSLITVTSLVFSMTLVTLTLASNQLGPRLLRTFMDDRVNQIVLGTFSGTFIYHLLILRSVRTGVEEFVPLVSLAFAQIMVVASVLLLIYFIHHLALSIQADTVIARVAEDLEQAIGTLFPPADTPARLPAASTMAPDFESRGAPFPVQGSGYVQAIDFQLLCDMATAHDLAIRLDRRPGDFVVANGPAGRIYPSGRADSEICKAASRAIVLGQARTPTQDIAFYVKALNEIALRALSPGINDVFTALTCIDRLGEFLAAVMKRSPAQEVYWDDKGNPRIFLFPVTFDELLDACLGEIRRAGCGQLAVIARLLGTLEALADFVRVPIHLESLQAQLEALAGVARNASLEPLDHASLENRIARVEAKLTDLRRSHPALTAASDDAG